jgi:hypothetical protein
LEDVSPLREIQLPSLRLVAVFAIAARQRAHPSSKSPIIF